MEQEFGCPTLILTTLLPQNVLHLCFIGFSINLIMHIRIVNTLWPYGTIAVKQATGYSEHKLAYE